MVDLYFMRDPLKKIREYINTNNGLIWNNQSHKLPVTKFSDTEVSFIDNYIKTHIN